MVDLDYDQRAAELGSPEKVASIYLKPGMPLWNHPLCFLITCVIVGLLGDALSSAEESSRPLPAGSNAVAIRVGRFARHLKSYPGRWDPSGVSNTESAVPRSGAASAGPRSRPTLAVSGPFCSLVPAKVPEVRRAVMSTASALAVWNES